MKKLILQVTAVMSLSVVLASCTGGGNPVIPTESAATLSGVVVISGEPLADLNNPGEVGVQDADKWALRVIDPTESVDGIEIDNGDTTFTTTVVDPLEIFLLQIELLPAVDLSGSSALVTPVKIDIAVPVSAVSDTKLTANIELVAPDVTSAAHETTQADGYRLIIGYTITGEQDSTELIELDWNRHQLRRDTNGNGRMDDEEYFTDSDRNGISDNMQQGMMGGQSHGSLLQVSGEVESIDTNLSRITVARQAFLIDETTVITAASQEIITLSELVLGQNVAVTGRKGMFGNVFAVSIQVLAK